MVTRRSATRSSTATARWFSPVIRSTVQTWLPPRRGPIFWFTTSSASVMSGWHGRAQKSTARQSHQNLRHPNRSPAHSRNRSLSGKEGDDLIVKQIRKDGYAGPMLMGEDRTIIDIDSKDIKVTPPRPTEHLPDLDNRNVKLYQVT